MSDVIRSHEKTTDGAHFIVADDHPMIRDALAFALGQAFAGAHIAMAATLAEVEVELERQPEIDALLLDLDMPGVNGTIGLTLVRSKYPAVPIIVVSASRDSAIVRRACECGASAYISKSTSFEEISRVVRAVLAGEIYSPPHQGPLDSLA